MLQVLNNATHALATVAMPYYTSFSHVTTDTVPTVNIGTIDITFLSQWLWLSLDISLFWKALAVFMMFINLKNLPFIYHLRILNGLRFVLRSQRSKKDLTPEQLFQPLITSSSATLMESDILGHKNNSTYFTDADIARVHLVMTLFSKAIEKFRGSTTMNGLSGQPHSQFSMPLGAVSCTFKRELKPYEPYDMWTRILSWDEKWFYLVTHFVRKGAKVEPEEYTMYPQQNAKRSKSRRSSVSSRKIPERAITATVMSKVVFKNGRITVPPKTMLEYSGLLPSDLEVVESTNIMASENITEEAGKATSRDDESGSDSGYESSRRTSVDSDFNSTMADQIETERLRGLKAAAVLAEQIDLEQEFSSQRALGRHTDGCGISGVVLTLAQLGKISSRQFL